MSFVKCSSIGPVTVQFDADELERLPPFGDVRWTLNATYFVRCWTLNATYFMCVGLSMPRTLCGIGNATKMSVKWFVKVVRNDKSDF